MNRREFLKAMGITGVAATLPLAPIIRKLGPNPAWAYASSPNLKKFMQALPALGKGLPIAVKDTVTYPGVDYYQIGIGQFTQQLHPQLPKATKLWGYYDATQPLSAQRHLGPLIIAQSGTPVRMKVTNNLVDGQGNPLPHPLPVDNSLPGAETGQAQNRTAVHLHGGFVYWTSDGGPFAWFLPNGTGGPDYLGNDYWYPNQQSARLMWYHDHAMGITRLNAHAGIAGGYLVQDAAEAQMVSTKMLPSAQIPLIFQDKIFKTEFDNWGSPGDLWYPYLYDTARWPWGGPNSPPVPSCVPEFFGDTMLVNGVVFPYVKVTPKRYRFRILNACNARFLRLHLFLAVNSTYFPGTTEVPSYTSLGPNTPGPKWQLIGTEGGFLARTHALSLPTLLLAPAERADVVVDFSKVPVGAKIILFNDAPAPFPGGDPRNDHYPGNPLTPLSRPGYGPNTRTVMSFHVVSGPAEPAYPALVLPPASPPLLWNWTTGAPYPGVTVAGTRDLTLNEDFDSYGRLIQRIGTNVKPAGSPSFGRNFLDAPTETPTAGTVEIWRFFNLTGDTHPLHFHLVNVQIISRQPFDVPNYNGTPTFTGPANPPPNEERGWKETVRMNPGQCTSVIMKFNLPTGGDPQFPAGIPFSPRLATFGINGYEYVHHCHILEHEEHDMMRPLAVV
jgi:spore coat protein A, manganese oxidase